MPTIAVNASNGYTNNLANIEDLREEPLLIFHSLRWSVSSKGTAAVPRTYRRENHDIVILVKLAENP